MRSFCAANEPFITSANVSSSDCLTGGLYKTPTKGQTVDASQPVTISWDTSCLNTTAVDIYLYAPSGNPPLIHEWENVNYKTGSYNATLKPGWWNSTSSVSLEFTIIPAGQPIFAVGGAAGPLFTATYSGNSTGDSAVAGAVEQVNNLPTEKHGPSKGAIAAAVIIPLLFIIGLIVVAYIRMNRQKGKEKRKRFSEMVDKRMSTISTDWKSLSGAGANAAIRNSMAVPGNRTSSFSFGGIRPASTVAVEGGQAGIGARGILAQDGLPHDAPYMSQLRPGLRTSAFENRVSRVSFAADPRTSSESRRARQSRAFHTSSVVVPPLPDRQHSSESSSNSSPILSPIQTAGPLSLTHEDIQARMAGGDAEHQSNYDEFMPALTMMRLGEQGGAQVEMPSAVQMPTPPSPTHQAPKSPILGAMPMQPMHANVMSPDAMLRAYAERRAMGATVPGSPAPPTPAANYNSMGMRVLYSPDTTASAASSTVYPVAASNSRKNLANTVYDDEDAYVGTAE
ncbi:hypothetical protein BD311DRAFT_669966 [Dichomitus squalens]|uniref:Uncharacterized protein n=1 Tax=Dichomitus squalens TaxID=114155 RepID=A0A4Q9MFF8_9APHY|nr:hypothetical protein BD311DRAFT_669966 [Dichomitus squalens]